MGGKANPKTEYKHGVLHGVLSVAQRVMNPISIPEDEGSIPGLAQWVKDLVLPQDVAWVWHCCGCGTGCSSSDVTPRLGNLHIPLVRCGPKKKNRSECPHEA